MSTENGSTDSQSGVRTYRGRTLEEILPQVKAELGPDAIVLREREGLVGGVGGFFAQRFIEIDARRADGQSIDIYDDMPGGDLPFTAAALSPGQNDEQPGLTTLPPEPIELGPGDPRTHNDAAAARPADGPSSESDPDQPSEPDSEPQAPTRRFETGLFMERLREASQALPEEIEYLAQPDPLSQPDLDAVVTERPAADESAIDEPVEAARETESARAERRPTPVDEAARSERRPTPVDEAARSERKPQPDDEAVTPEREPARSSQRQSRGASDRPTRPRPERPRPERSRPERRPPTRREAPTSGAAPEPVQEQPAHSNPYESVRRRPAFAAPERSSARQSATPPSASRSGSAAGAVPPSPQSPQTFAPILYSPSTESALLHAPARPRPAREQGLRAVIGRLLGGRRSRTPAPAPGRPLDQIAAAAAVSELSARGASPTWAAQLISTAGAHGAPLSGDLREAAEAEVARRILAPPTLPATGAAIAFVGAGGSGKTRCTAALASAYRRGSTLAVSVIALDNPDGARSLQRMLRSENVPVQSLNVDKAQRAIAELRHGGLVIVDTPAVTPTDAQAVRDLGEKLRALGLDAVYVALPATLGQQAARRALAMFGELSPSAITITHADETDQLAVAIEIAITHRIPLAHVHGGTDHRTALFAVEPRDIAHHLLP